MEDFALTTAERRLFQALEERGVRFLVIGLSAAVLEGAPVATQDIDDWLEKIDERVARAAANAKGFWISGFGVQPPACGALDLERIDVVLTAHGLKDFATEYEGSVVREVDGIPLHVLPLERVIARKRAGQELGTLPISHPLSDGAFIIFAGKRWRVMDVDVERRIVVLSPAPAGRAPLFTGGGAEVHDRVREEMRAVYESTDVPSFLDPVAKELLQEARDVSLGDELLSIDYASAKLDTEGTWNAVIRVVGTLDAEIAC